MQNTTSAAVAINQDIINETTPFLDSNNKHVAQEYNNSNYVSVSVNSDDDGETPTVRRTERYGKMQTGAAVTGLALVPTTVSFYFLHALALGLKNIKEIKEESLWLDFAEAAITLVLFLMYASLCYRFIFRDNQNNIRSLIAPRGPVKAAYANRKHEANQTQDQKATYIYRSELKHQQWVGKDTGSYHLSVRKLINIDFEFYLAVIRQHLSVLDLYDEAELTTKTVSQKVVGNYLIAYLLLTKLSFLTFRFDQFAVDANKDLGLRDNTKYIELLAQELKNLNSQPMDMASIKQLMQQKKAKFINSTPHLFDKADNIVKNYEQQDHDIKKELLAQNQFHNPVAYRNIFHSSSEKQITHRVIARYAQEYQTGSEHKFNIAPS
jgi:hypothetical protein